MLDYEQLLLFINEYNGHYRELLEFETKKFSLIAVDNIEEISKALSREQALIMKSTAYENKRMKLLSDVKGKSFPEIISSAPERYKSRLSDGYHELKRLVLQIKSVNDNAQEIVSQRLTRLEDIRNGNANSYGEDGKKRRPESTGTLNKDI